MKDTFYFSHDYNARNDAKIKNLIRKHGINGYGIFWAIVEDLYNNANALPTDYESIAYDLRTDSEIIKSVINDFDLFVLDGGNFGSLSIEKRINERNEKSKNARLAAESRWNKVKEDANAMQTHSNRNAIKERKGNEINESKEKKGNESKGNETADFEILIYPTFEDFWNLYDLKKGDKDKIKKKFDDLTQKVKEDIMNYLPLYIKSTPDKQYRKHPETFINNKSWNDEIIFKKNGTEQTSKNQHIRDSIRADFERDLANGFSNPTK